MSAARRLELDFSDEPTSLPRLVVKVRVTADSRNNFWLGLDGHIAEGGVFVATHRRAPPVGTLVLVQMQVGFQKEEVAALAAVRWVQSLSPWNELEPGFGLEFVDIEPATIEIIARFAARIREPLLFDD